MDNLEQVEDEWLEVTARERIREGESVGDYHQRVLALCHVATAETVRAYLRIVETHWVEPGFIQRTITDEEIRYHKQMAKGRKLLAKELSQLPTGGVLPGELVFFLRATHGLEIDIIRDVCEEQGFGVDMEGYESAMQKHAEMSRNKKLPKSLRG